MDKRSFIEFSEEHNKNFVFLVVDNTSQSNSPEDFLLKVKVSPEEAQRISEPKTEPEDARSQSSEKESY